MNGRPAITKVFIGLAIAIAIARRCVVFGALAGTPSSSSSPAPSGSDVAGSPRPRRRQPPRRLRHPARRLNRPLRPSRPRHRHPRPKLVPAPLTGIPVGEGVAKRHVIAVMVDDHWDARPQSGFN